MKHSLYFFLTITLCITTTSITMEPELPKAKKYLASKNILATLTIIEDPHNAQFLTNDHVVIINRTQCSIVDFKTHEEIKKINLESDNHRLVVDQNRKTLALYNDKNITIYNTKTTTTEKFPTKVGCAAHFDPSDTAIFIDNWPQEPYTITKLNYVTHLQQEALKLNGATTFAIHPIQQRIATNLKKDIFIHQLNDPSAQPQKIHLSIYPHDIQYSSNGSCLAAHTVADITIVDPTTATFRDISVEENTRFENVRFHPHGSVLAAISDHFKEKIFTISYWDIKKQPIALSRTCHSTQPLIAQMTLDLLDNHDDDYDVDCDFHFSPDNTKLIIAPINKKCIILNVPFEVLYQDITKEEFLYLLFLFNNIKPQIDYEIPQDVTQLIAKTLLTTYKR